MAVWIFFLCSQTAQTFLGTFYRDLETRVHASHVLRVEGLVYKNVFLDSLMVLYFCIGFLELSHLTRDLSQVFVIAFSFLLKRRIVYRKVNFFSLTIMLATSKKSNFAVLANSLT